MRRLRSLTVAAQCASRGSLCESWIIVRIATVTPPYIAGSPTPPPRSTSRAPPEATAITARTNSPRSLHPIHCHDHRIFARAQIRDHHVRLRQAHETRCQPQKLHRRLGAPDRRLIRQPRPQQRVRRGCRASRDLPIQRPNAYQIHRDHAPFRRRVRRGVEAEVLVLRQRIAIRAWQQIGRRACHLERHRCARPAPAGHGRTRRPRSGFIRKLKIDLAWTHVDQRHRRPVHRDTHAVQRIRQRRRRGRADTPARFVP